MFVPESTSKVSTSLFNTNNYTYGKTSVKTTLTVIHVPMDSHVHMYL